MAQVQAHGGPELQAAERESRGTEESGEEEKREAAQEFDEDIYALIIDARQDEGQCFEEEPPGDRVTLYRAEQFFKRGEL